MTQNVLSSEVNLIQTLTTLNQIGAKITQLGMGGNLLTTLRLIANGAVQAVAASDQPHRKVTAQASTVIWVYDEAQQEFDLEFRVSAGEPAGASVDDFPRPEGLGRMAIKLQQRQLSYHNYTPQIHPLKVQAGARSLVCYPLIVSNETVGVLYVYRCDDSHFNEIELLLLDNFVHLAGMAIHYGRKVGGLNTALSRKVKEMEKLRRASHLISSRTNLDDTLHEILSIGLDMTAAQYGSFELYDKAQNRLVIRALAGSNISPTVGPPLLLNKKSVVGHVAVIRKSLRIDNLQATPWNAIYQPLPSDREMRSELAVPLIDAGGVLEGVLNIESPQLNAFTQEDQYLLEALATQAIIAIQEIKLLDAMQEIVQVLLTAPVDELLRLIIDRACDLINVSAGSIWIVSEPDTLTLRKSTDSLRLGQQLSLSKSVTGRAVRLRQPVTVDDIRFNTEFQNQELAQEKGWISAIVVPLLAPHDNENPVGSFSLYTTQLRDFSEWDKKLLTCLANHAAVAIRDAEYLTELKDMQEQRAIAETFAAVGDVGANLLHQLNNKFGAISVRVQGIEDKCEDILAKSPYLVDNLQEIAQSTQQSMAIVRNSMAQLRPMQPHPVEVLPAVKSAIHRAGPADRVETTLFGLADLPRVWASAQQLEMVIYNLIDNALKAIQQQGQLYITGVQLEDEVSITVRDNGPGIAPDLAAHIFEFTALKKEKKEQNDRLGFGLWWVKTFVDRFGGRVSVVSEPGEGAAFTVWLPAEKRM